MKEKIVKALLNQAKYYALLSKRAARAAKYASGPEKEILKERAKRLLSVSQDYFQRAKKLGGQDGKRE